MIPGFGEPLDAINAGISLARGNYADAALSVAAMWPVGGQAATAGKLTNKAGQAVIENLDKADEALAGLSKMSDEFTDMILNQPCFPAGTPILTPLGHTLIEDLRVGDAVLSRPEYDAHASTNWQKVEAVYTRESEVMELHVCGRVIKTTEEHPFWVKDYGWVAAGELEAGDQFSTHDGNWITLDEIRYTGEWTTVYNFRVQEDHTYFVGQAEWGVTVWVHNTHSDYLVTIYKAPSPGNGNRLLHEGVNTVDEAGSTFFAKQRELAEDYAYHYGEGVLEVDMHSSIYDHVFRKFETPYPSNPNFVELEIPSSVYGTLNSLCFVERLLDCTLFGLTPQCVCEDVHGSFDEQSVLGS